MGDIFKEPVVIRRAEFCIVCSFRIAESEALGNHNGAAYVWSGLRRHLYVKASVSFCCPQVEPARDLRIRKRDAALSAIEFICGEKVRWVSKMTPKIFGRRSSGSG